MTEQIRYTKIYREDLALGTGTEEVTLADGQVVALHQIDIEDLTKIIATGSSVPRSLADWMADFAIDKAYGVVGDGVADDTANLNLAGATGKCVLLTGTSYKITGVVTGKFYSLNTTALTYTGSAKFPFLGIHQPKTNTIAPTSGCIINRFGDRLFVGDAVDSDAVVPNIDQDWMTAYQISTGQGNGSIITSQMASLTTINASSCFGGLFGAQAKYRVNPAAIGMMGFGLANHATLHVPAWGGYFEAHRDTPTTSNAFGIEIDVRVKAKVPDKASLPNQQSESGALQLGAGCGVTVGTTDTVTMTLANPAVLTTTSPHGLSIDDPISLKTTGTLPTSLIPGEGEIYYVITTPTPSSLTIARTIGGTEISTLALAQSGTHTINYLIQTNVGCAINVVHNKMKFRRGFVFMKDSLEGTDGIVGSAIALAMVRGHTINWFNTSNSAVGEIANTNAVAADAIRLDLGPAGLTVQDRTTGSIALLVNTVPSSVNRFTMTPTLAASPPILATTGTDTDIDISFAPKGAGVMRFGTFTGGGDTVSNGYITIKDSGGTVRKIMVTA